MSSATDHSTDAVALESRREWRRAAIAWSLAAKAIVGAGRLERRNFAKFAAECRTKAKGGGDA